MDCAWQAPLPVLRRHRAARPRRRRSRRRRAHHRAAGLRRTPPAYVYGAQQLTIIGTPRPAQGALFAAH
ncbi:MULTISPECIES: hypothetical protein [Streptomyces]|uniref:hypothetical protein n=1 Tax=Streptomyces TaxID=1883 RepID=UPI0002D2DF32|nr:MULTISPECIES: hypothetical protein [Streptomyces]WSU72655.1 hypothetical protein OG499_06740 [Streptomyces anulatus]WTD28955.1 hypothetical protein OH737_32525 [Streptomyces anulatus]